MKKVRVYHDKKGNTLTVWFDDAKKEAMAAEIGEDIVIMKDKNGEVIGLEKLNYVVPFSKVNQNLPIEVISA